MSVIYPCVDSGRVYKHGGIVRDCPEELRKMQEVFELLIKTPEGVDINSLLTDAVTDNYDRSIFDRTFSALEKMEKYFGMDFRGGIYAAERGDR